MKTLRFVSLVCTLFILISSQSNIFSQTIFVTKLNDLDFGDVFIGYSKEVQFTDISAAKFSFYHTQFLRRTLYVNFNLPSNLNNGAAQIPITFDQSHSAYSFFDQVNNSTNFNPHSTLVLNNAWFYIPVYVYLGATINTSAGQPFGIYTGTIILTVAY